MEVNPAELSSQCLQAATAQAEQQQQSAELLPRGPASLQADSLVTLLTQDLRSQDKHLLER